MESAVVRNPFPVPEWCRTIWASREAQAYWEPRIRAIGAAWDVVERASVGQFRLACRQSVSPDQLPELSAKAVGAGLSLFVLDQHASSNTYQSGPSMKQPGQPWSYQVVLAASPIAAKTYAVAHQAGDHRVIGDLLGFPPCCIEFFQRVWIDEKWIDTTWPMAMNTAYHYTDDRLDNPIYPRVYDVPPNVGVVPRSYETNILLRWLGVRRVPHLPCSFNCNGTHGLGKMFGKLLSDAFPQEYEWMLQLLSASVEWSALHGIAEIKLPICKVSAKTDHTNEKLTVRRQGTAELEMSARGTVFPYLVKPVETKMVTLHRPSDEWTMNGFSSLEAMEKAHLELQAYYMTHFGLLKQPRILDLGCGNGRLVSGLSTLTAGIEIDSNRAKAAESRLASVYSGLIEQFVQHSTDCYDVAFLMPGRLDEMDPTAQIVVSAWLKEHCENVIIYHYERKLAAMCDRLKLPIKDIVETPYVHIAQLEMK